VGGEGEGEGVPFQAKGREEGRLTHQRLERNENEKGRDPVKKMPSSGRPRSMGTTRASLSRLLFIGL
jgi:hypothetical protein